MKILGIERISASGAAQPMVGPRGYRLADPAKGRDRARPEHALHVATLAEAALLVDAGYCLWMRAEGGRPALVSPPDLRILWG